MDGNNDFVDLLKDMLNKARLEEANAYAFQTDFCDGTDHGYANSLEDLIIFLKYGDRNKMYRPHLYLHAQSIKAKEPL